jgi:hypothetical protein
MLFPVDKKKRQQHKKVLDKKITIPDTVDGSTFALSARHLKLPGADPDGAPSRAWTGRPACARSSRQGAGR